MPSEQSLKNLEKARAVRMQRREEALARGEKPKKRSTMITNDIKQAIIHAFDQVGGEDYLVWLAHKEPKSFAALLGKLLPTKLDEDSANLVGQSMIAMLQAGRDRVAEAAKDVSPTPPTTKHLEH